MSERKLMDITHFQSECVVGYSRYAHIPISESSKLFTKYNLFEFIKQCAVNTGKSHNGEVCTLLISKNDKKRLPDNFTDILSDVSHIKISETVVDLKIDFGVIFDFDGIYENCTVDALFDEKYSEICDALFDLINA